MTTDSILITDDSQENRMLLKGLLEDNYSVAEADSGEACLSAIAESPPSLVLLDINMPGKSGYEVCIELRKNSRTSSLPVIFVSGMDSTEERLAGFEAGADDFVTKPVDFEQLSNKIESILHKGKELKTARENASGAVQVAVEAMTSGSELGQVIQFVKRLQELDTEEKVGLAIVDIMNAFKLNVSVLIFGDSPLFVGCKENSIEAKLLEKFRMAKERITNSGIRTIILSKNFIFLVKNMPLDDESRYGRFKDHLAILADIADKRLESLKMKQALENHKVEVLKQVIQLTEQKVAYVKEKIQLHTGNINDEMNGMIANLQGILFSLSLDEDQEIKLMALASDTSNKLQESAKNTAHLDSNLTRVLEALYKLLEEHQ
ncbi:response regulator [Aliikangiella coralliicola]|uniref:Response regulator n=1 Tax=Aliikangiella coralliicola TaxID=2592383 RepID=A0A545UH95_9GAMM|nr:response regulator [Aliikangiella coralliicola]TQV88835.1 response regulator [Aliikangiella coralliicola]